MGKFIDITGQVFGRLTVLGYSHKDHHRNSYWKCRCACGKELVVLKSNLTCGKTLSCGCYNREQNSLNHQLGKDLDRTCLYNKWINMKRRCYNPTTDGYKDYGGRGITVCDDWINDFDNFFQWSMKNGYKKGLTIDRIDVNGNYCPKNCRFVTQKQQANNKTNNRYITCDNKTLTLSQWANILKVDSCYIRYRLNKGIPFDILKESLLKNKSINEEEYYE